MTRKLTLRKPMYFIPVSLAQGGMERPSGTKVSVTLNLGLGFATAYTERSCSEASAPAIS